MASNQVASDSAPDKQALRFSFPIGVFILAAIAITTLWVIDADFLLRGAQASLTYMITVLTVLIVAVWFFAFSGAPGKVRLIGAGLAALIIGGAVAAIRSIEFTGDMAPILSFRWEQERNEALEQHRAAHTAADAFTVNFSTVSLTDVAEYRGPHRDGIVDGPPLARDWSTDPPKKLWRQPVGGGYSAFLYVNGALVTIEQRRDNEAIVCYDAATGNEIWVYEYPALFHEQLGGDGPRATPAIVNGKVYSFGATGVLVCLDGATGREIWKTDVLKDNQVANLDWGMAGSPLVYDGKVVVNPGAQKGTGDSRALIAFDAETGAPLWGTGDTQSSYASPMLADIGGKTQILTFDAYGLIGYDAADGKKLWHRHWKSDYDTNAAQPIVLADDHIFFSSQNGSDLVKIEQQGEKWDWKSLWEKSESRNLKAAYANVIHKDGFVYGLDNGILTCVELQNGKRRWKNGRYGHGQILLTGDLLLVLSEKGELVLVEANPNQFRELAKIQAIEGRTWNNHILVNGVAYVRNHLEMAAYKLPLAGETQTVVTPEPKPETPTDDAPPTN